MRSRPLLRVASLLLALVVCLGAIQAPEASIRIIFRFAVLSWDNPATQLFDELICESSPPSQAGAEAGQSTRLGVGVSSRLLVDSIAPHPEGPALSSGITRSPPAA